MPVDVAARECSPAVQKGWEALLGRLWLQDQKTPWVLQDGYVWRMMPHGLATKMPAPVMPTSVALQATPFRSFTTAPVVTGAGVFDARGKRVADWLPYDPPEDLLEVRWDAPVERVSLPPLSPRLANVPRIESLFMPSVMDFTLFEDYLLLSIGQRTAVLSLYPPRSNSAAPLEQDAFLHWLRERRDDHLHIGCVGGPFNWPSNMLAVFREAARSKVRLAACWMPGDAERKCSCSHMMVCGVDGAEGYAVSAIYRDGMLFRHQLVEGPPSRPLAQPQALLWKASYDEVSSFADSLVHGRDVVVQPVTAQVLAEMATIRAALASSGGAVGGLAEQFAEAEARVASWENGQWVCQRHTDSKQQREGTSINVGPWVSLAYLAALFDNPSALRVGWKPPEAHHFLWDSEAGVCLYTYSVVNSF